MHFFFFLYVMPDILKISMNSGAWIPYNKDYYRLLSRGIRSVFAHGFELLMSDSWITKIEFNQAALFFVLQQQKHCIPAALEMYYTEEQQQEPGVHGSTNTGLYAALSHLNQVKGTGPELPSPWLPVISTLKKTKEAREDQRGQWATERRAAGRRVEM